MASGGSSPVHREQLVDSWLAWKFTCFIFSLNWTLCVGSNSSAVRFPFQRRPRDGIFSMEMFPILIPSSCDICLGELMPHFSFLLMFRFYIDSLFLCYLKVGMAVRAVQKKNKKQNLVCVLRQIFSLIWKLPTMIAKRIRTCQRVLAYEISLKWNH